MTETFRKFIHLKVMFIVAKAIAVAVAESPDLYFYLIDSSTDDYGFTDLSMKEFSKSFL